MDKDVQDAISLLERLGYQVIEPTTEVTDIVFEEFWNKYDKKVGKEKARKLWSKLSRKDKSAAMDYCDSYKRAQPNKQYRKNPETFLRNKAWKDEIIDSNQFIGEYDRQREILERTIKVTFDQ